MLTALSVINNISVYPGWINGRYNDNVHHTELGVKGLSGGFSVGIEYEIERVFTETGIWCDLVKEI